MARLKLRSDHLEVLKAIQNYGPINVPDLVEKSKLNRGMVEAAIGTLAQEGHIERVTENQIRHRLTSRGQKASSGLPERVILEVLLEDSVHMKDLPQKTNLEKSDMTAGIGILKRAGLVKIDKGTLVVVDSEKAENYSVDLQKALSELANGSTKLKKKTVIEELLRRGLIEELENTITTVSTEYTKKKVDSAAVVEEVTKLTPKMIADGSWENVNFKPYSLTTKPRTLYPGRMQPYKEFIEQLKRKLVGLGFVEMKGPIIEQEFWNFDALNAPQDHPAREDSDILLIKDPSQGKLQKKKYVKNVAATHENGWETGSLGHGYKWNPEKAARLLLRPQGTAISARTLAHLEPPAKYFSVARCYRPDQIDATHAIEFNQTEGIICDPDITFRDLLGMLKTFAVEVAGADEVRFRPDYYPFTAPSVELSAKHPTLGYIEFGGAGIFRPEVVRPFGIDYPVLAWGLGVERLFMTKYEIKDIRELYSQNLEWLRSERVSAGMEVS